MTGSADGSRTALITGGNQGIGAALAARLLHEGFIVVSLGLDLPTKAHPNLHGEVVDLLDNDAVIAVADAVTKKFGVTHLFHNAGQVRPALLEQAKASDLAALTQLHLGSALTLLQACLPTMKARRFGRVVFTSSRAALGVPTRTAYSATKAGISGMARTWALELASHGVTVNVVAPGPVLTDNFWDIVPKGSEQESELARRIPVGRLGTVDDVSRALMFFAADDSSFITGQTLYVCGGASVGSMSLG